MSLVVKNLGSTIALFEAIRNDARLVSVIESAAADIVAAFRNNKKVLFCGNGGSAADAQHLAAEFSGRFYFDRAPLYAEALHVNTSYLTAVANDYSYNEVYARLVKAKGAAGDVLVGLTTSGNSGNIIKACAVAREKEMTVVGFTGKGGGMMASLCHRLIDVPSTDTPRIQEAHIAIGHIICEFVESAIFGGKP